MKTIIAYIFVYLVPTSIYGQEMPPPIIDMHLHASSLSDFEQLAGPAPIPHCVPMTDYPVPGSGSGWPEVFRSRENPCQATWSPLSDDDVMEQTFEIMKRQNVIGVTSGPNITRWREDMPERIIPSLSFHGGPGVLSVDEVRKLLEEGQFTVFGEVTTQYGGIKTG